MQVRLSWDDPESRQRQENIYSVPVALGRSLEEVLNENQKQEFSLAILNTTPNNTQISRFHALISLVNNQLMIEDRSTNGTVVNGQRIVKNTSPLGNGDTIQIGPYIISLIVVRPATQETQAPPTFSPETTSISPQATSISNQPGDSRVLFDAGTNLLYPGYNQQMANIQLPGVFNNDRVSVEELKTKIRLSNYEEKDYVALGGGLGSFTWVDTIRIGGVKPDQIRVLGRGEAKPYGRYQQICRNSQIPDHERLRSGSDSCPDNIWGWPGYAWREAWRELFKGRAHRTIKYLWQVFAEPALADTYTPRSGDVFASIDREALRIGWYDIWSVGQVRAIRKTTDDRYVIAHFDPSASKPEYRFLIAQYLHISTGYTSVKFLDDLQEYRRTTKDTKRLVNAYESHEHVYQKLKQSGGTIILRGEGIVASRVLQKVYELRCAKSNIKIIHLLRSEKTEANKFGLAKRYRENGWEFQPYNWPKGTWGGDMRSNLESGSPAERQQLLSNWGGTTTASRSDWRRIVREGVQQLWYERKVGVVEKIEHNEKDQLLIHIQRRNLNSKEIINADFIVDATGLIAKPKEDPLLRDLVTHYDLPLNPLDGLHVANSFEIEKMRNGRGRMFAAGVMTLGGPYAPVDTFLGLQYAAQRAADALAHVRAKNLSHLGNIGSLWQWIRWATNQKP